MKPIIREYLASLREREELDVLIPNLLSELGYMVFSRPSRGTRQFGVDVAAIGPGDDDRVYLFSIKRGDLTRSEWNGSSDQALRPSLDEIFDAYIPHHLPPEYSRKRIVICPCFGGEVLESAHEAFHGYMSNKQNERVEFSVWNGDRIAGFLQDGLLREDLMASGSRVSLRKAIAMVDEPETSTAHFNRFVDALATSAADVDDVARIRIARQMSIGLWILFVWARDQNNLESSYLGSEYALLRFWDIGKELLASGTKASEDMGDILTELVDLHFDIWNELVDRKVLPHAGMQDAISAAVRTSSPLDVNLKLFDIMGRISLHGLWLVWIGDRSGSLPVLRERNHQDLRIDILAQKLWSLVVANPVLTTPISDHQVIDLSLGFMLLARAGRFIELQTWISQVVQRSTFLYRSHGQFPCDLADYAELCEHPRSSSDDYLKSVTKGSSLLPTLAFWSAALEDEETLTILETLKSQILSHCTIQLWLPDEETETGLWRGRDDHGASFCDIPLIRDGQKILTYVRRECGQDTPFFELSAVKQGFWPLVLVACRHYRLPISPHLFDSLLQGFEKLSPGIGRMSSEYIGKQSLMSSTASFALSRVVP